MSGGDPDLAGEALWRRLFDAYPDGALVVEPSGRIAQANASAAALFGYAPDALVGMNVDALVPVAARPRHAQLRQAYERTPSKRPMGLDMELSARRADGSEIMVEIALSPLQLPGRRVVLAAVRGVGEYPRVQRALRRARFAEAIAEVGRLAVDAQEAGAVLAAVPRSAARALEAQAAALFVASEAGAASATPVLGGAWGEALAVPDAAALAAAGAPFVEPAAVPGRKRLVVPVRERGRGVAWLEVQATLPDADEPEALRFLGSLASLAATVMQRAAADAALSHAQRLEAVGQLTGGIAHDFNNLLTVIHGNLQVLEDLPALAADPLAQDLVAAAQRASRRGGDLTSKLLAFSRRQHLQPRALDLRALLPALTTLLRRTLDARIRIELEIAPDTPYCRADPAQLESALLNLAINARDAMPEGGTLAFTAERCGEPPPDADLEAWRGGGVALSVRDSGCGMSEAVRQRAFEPFFTTKDASRGTGLGLATVHGFAHQSHGAVGLASREGEGTTVTLYLPSPIEAAEPAPREGGQAAALRPGLEVLLVEDEPEVLTVMRHFLEAQQARVTAFAEAESALAALAGTRFDLLISDIVLGPGLRGDQLAERARALQPKLAVLLVSGYAPQRDEAGDAALPWPLLRKPFTRERFIAAAAAATPPPRG